MTGAGVCTLLELNWYGEPQYVPELVAPSGSSCTPPGVHQTVQISVALRLREQTSAYKLLIFNMPQSSSQTPSGAKKSRDKSSKSSTESKLELLTSTNSITKAVKTESDQNTESQSVPNPKQGMFARFMRQVVGEHPQGMRAGPNNGDTRGDQGATNAEIAKTTDQQSVDSIAAGSIKSAQPEGHRNGSGIAACSNRSEAVVKVEDTPSQETIRIRDYIFQGGNIINRNKNNHQTKQHVHGNIAIPHSSVAQCKADIQRNRGADDSLRRLNSQEEQNGVTMDKLSHNGVSEQEAETSKEDEMKDADESTISADTGDAMEKSHQRSEEKGKHKHSRKRSKSRGRSKSPKRRKVSETFVPNHLREDTESSSDEEESLDGFDVEQARARLPKGCSVRHEGDQKEELKDGKRFSKSIKFTNIMVSTLKDHQTTLFSWMVKREKENPRQACGGIVGDEMGLGKTVISLACIAANQPTKEDQKKYSQATLVLVPARRYAIQWRDEAIKHWTEEASSRVAIYNPNSDWGPRQYEKQLIVIATYPQLRNHYPTREITKSLCDQYPDDGDSFDREFRKEAKDLLRIKWFRVILDEGHGATKWNGRTLESCCAIQAKHRWVLTGTPIQNTPIEYYSYATFICCRFLNSRRVFRNEFIIKNATNDDFDTLNSYLMYRRTSNEKLDIPPTTHREVYVEVSREEDMICKAINNFYHGRAEIHQRKKEEAQMPIFDNDEDEDEVEDVASEEEEDEDSNSRNKEPRTRSIQTSKQLRLRQALSHPYCLEKFLLAPNRLSEDELKCLASDLNSISEKKTMIEHSG
ncbi:hypothetical protein H0G86_011608 [Trichoderma simmonsii]|uniref:Helicase ATP-binding domain-containing protein n=1 Tax=Trichoderma simmonsii TaxID=1491479 RepID=A0A8G0PQ41_9HYPO|nr:hypothetical protein H0G86_011608 [Trichoderma simmonsii]